MDPGFSVPDRIDLLELETEETNVQKSGLDLVTREHIAIEERDEKKHAG